MARSIMIQGTTSSAGKSFLAAGLCRIFYRDGYRTAPFKSQNMALNSYITRDGLEMGRAQVMQAEAAGREPDVRMNPILLKPTSHMGSQVIVNGEVRGTMSAAEYFQHKADLIPEVKRAYASLAAENDMIVLEGAGSPAEINLKENDIVNMGMAAMADAPVLLVGDIDRGGVFASLYGTVALLTEEERHRVKGLVINKFRGDEEILRPGLAMLEDLTGIPVLGVIPYLEMDLDDEDSLSPRLDKKTTQKPVDIAVIRLPYLSNFTDFIPLERHPSLGVRYVRSAGELKHPDLVILPGTKNTMDDLLWLRQSGLEAAVCRLAEEGIPVLGICGGYQMMGLTLRDPLNVERGGELRGMGLLPVQTEFTPQKTRTRVQAGLCPETGFFKALAGKEAEGYEIHMGRTAREQGCAPFAVLSSGPDGAVCGSAAGTYLHGLFESSAVTDALARALCLRKGVSPEEVQGIDHMSYKEKQYDSLAGALRRCLDMEAVYRICEEGVK
ncbi:MAG: cobyric acid synthase [Oscillospiraceae bacterium]|nr:cobyric acid synthase [Oscillospiraceae bacterium]